VITRRPRRRHHYRERGITLEHDTDAVDEMAMQSYQTRVQHWYMKAMEERQLDLPDDPASMFE
jgi:hypothetical protein